MVVRAWWIFWSIRQERSARIRADQAKTADFLTKNSCRLIIFCKSIIHRSGSSRLVSISSRNLTILTFLSLVDLGRGERSTNSFFRSLLAKPSLEQANNFSSTSHCNCNSSYHFYIHHLFSLHQAATNPIHHSELSERWRRIISRWLTHGHSQQSSIECEKWTIFTRCLCVRLTITAGVFHHSKRLFERLCFFSIYPAVADFLFALSVLELASTDQCSRISIWIDEVDYSACYLARRFHLFGCWKWSGTTSGSSEESSDDVAWRLHLLRIRNHHAHSWSLMATPLHLIIDTLDGFSFILCFALGMLISLLFRSMNGIHLE